MYTIGAIGRCFRHKEAGRRRDQSLGLQVRDPSAQRDREGQETGRERSHQPGRKQRWICHKGRKRLQLISSFDPDP
ncbi:MAG: hypothetical protein ACK518_01485 [bacterium]